jgi:hypothetical protein
METLLGTAQVTVWPLLLVVSPAPETTTPFTTEEQAFPTGSDSVSYVSPLFRIFRFLDPLQVAGQEAVQEIDSLASVDSASAATTSQPVAGVPSGEMTVIPVIVIVVVPAPF